MTTLYPNPCYTCINSSIIKGLHCYFTFSDHEVGSPTIGQQNRHKITATLGLVVHAAGKLIILI